MQLSKENEPILRRADGTFEIRVNGLGYGVVNNEEGEQFTLLDVEEYIHTNPDSVQESPADLRPVPLIVEEARSRRDLLLAASDFSQLADAPVDKEAWATYRQALRDVPEQKGFPNTITWPVRP
jgi:hypothetical protein